MASRSIYLRVAALLRANHEAIGTGDRHRHTRLALALRTDVLDSTIRYQASLHYMSAWAAMHSHPQIDIESAGGSLPDLYADALGHVKYLTGGKTGEEIKMGDREAAIERYNEYRRRVLKDPNVPLTSQRPEAPKAAQKHKAG